LGTLSSPARLVQGRGDCSSLSFNGERAMEVLSESRREQRRGTTRGAGPSNRHRQLPRIEHAPTRNTPLAARLADPPSGVRSRWMVDPLVPAIADKEARSRMASTALVQEATPLIPARPGNPKRPNPVLQATRISVSMCCRSTLAKLACVRRIILRPILPEPCAVEHLQAVLKTNAAQIGESACESDLTDRA